MARDDVLRDLRYVPGPVPSDYHSDHIERELLDISDTLQRYKDPGWDDLRAAAAAINPPGSASDPGRDAATGLLSYDAASTEQVFVLFQMPHAWVVGTAIYPHVHWAKSTSASGDVAWQCRYKLWPINGVLSASWTDLGVVTSPVVGTPDTDTADKQLITDFGDVDMRSLDHSDSILFELSRVGGAVADTYGADAVMVEFDAHYQSNRWGSVEQSAH